MHIDESQLEKFIVDSALISKKDLESIKIAAEEDGPSLGDVLVSRGVLTSDDLRRATAHVLGIPFVDLKNHKIDFEVLSFIPEPMARNHNIVAFKKAGDSLEVAMLNIESLKSIEFIHKKLGLKVVPRLTDEASMKSALLSYQKILKAEFGDIIQREALALKTAGGGLDQDESYLRKLSEDTSVVRIVETLLKHALLQKASYIHIEPEENQILIHYRIHGALYDVMVLPKNTASGITARIKALSNLKLGETNLLQDGSFRIESESDVVSFRVSTLPVSHGERIVMRIFRENTSGFTLESLGFQGQGLEDLYKTLALTSGLVLVTGPKGSGKTTTLYTMIDILNTPDMSICTIENPVEYQMDRVSQTQVNPKIGLTYSNGLRAILRQDPDVIMVGEIRDEETALLALGAACTGHLVLVSMEASSSVEAVSRLKKFGVSPDMLASSLKLILEQKLIPNPKGGLTGEHKVLSQF